MQVFFVQKYGWQKTRIFLQTKKSHSNALVTQKGFACEMVARANYSYHRLPKSDFWVCPHFSKTPLSSFFACSIIDFQLKKVSLVKMAFDKKISGNYYY